MTHSIRERIVRELVRRIGANEIDGISFARVQRSEFPEGYDASQGSVLAVLEGHEELGLSTIDRRNKLSLYFNFAVPLGEGEEAQTVANDTAAHLATALHGTMTLEEGGEGTGGQKLSATFMADAVEPDLIQQNADCAAATVVLQVQYRTQPRTLFAA